MQVADVWIAARHSAVSQSAARRDLGGEFLGYPCPGHPLDPDVLGPGVYRVYPSSGVYRVVGIPAIQVEAHRRQRLLPLEVACRLVQGTFSASLRRVGGASPPSE